MYWFILKFLICVYALIKIIVLFTNAQCKSKICLVGKTALITGGNSGLGLELAKILASKGCTIILADKDDASLTVEELIKETHNPNISAKIVDFASFKSVRMFAADINQTVSHLHILINNAGIGDISDTKTEDGLQKIMQVNYYSHFLLTHKLIDLLLKSSPSRIIFTSSIAAYNSALSTDKLRGESVKETGLFESGAYGNSKLAGAMMSRVLAWKLKDTKVTSNTFHPGFVKTNIWNTIKGVKFIRYFLWKLWTDIFGKRPEEGAQTMAYLACADEVENTTGKFFMECRPVWHPRKVYDKKLCEKVWNLSEEYVDLRPEEKIDNILNKQLKKK